MNDSKTYDILDSAWRLAMRLLLSDDGKLCGTYDDIARQLGGISKDSVRNWVKRLSEQEVIRAEQKGWQVKLTLLGKFMSIAVAPHVIHDAVQVMPPENAALTALRKVAEGVEELGGRIVLTIEGCTIGSTRGIKAA